MLITLQLINLMWPELLPHRCQNTASDRLSNKPAIEVIGEELPYPMEVNNATA